MKLAKKSSAAPKTAIPQPNRESALLLVDLQNDFFPGGAMGVNGADTLLPTINTYIQFFSNHGFPVLATRDWHSPEHCSFTEQNGELPIHCVQGSRGAQLHAQLVMPPGTMVISKGTNPKKDAYSGFDGTSLSDRLEDLGSKTIFVLGLATDHCVKQTVLDGIKLGLQVIVLEDATRGVNRQPEDSQNALQEMATAGAIRATAKDLGIQLPPA